MGYLQVLGPSHPSKSKKIENAIAVLEGGIGPNDTFHKPAQFSMPPYQFAHTNQLRCFVANFSVASWLSGRGGKCFSGPNQCNLQFASLLEWRCIITTCYSRFAWLQKHLFGGHVTSAPQFHQQNLLGIGIRLSKPLFLCKESRSATTPKRAFSLRRSGLRKDLLTVRQETRAKCSLMVLAENLKNTKKQALAETNTRTMCESILGAHDTLNAHIA